ncbi:unnamed protein product [Brassicogethes aeneus]|uniref:C2H2-type domain-containing protein n=1 Tax=Brassicogethes aeneus TaxID=1431903 RepID=A0A9P0FD02_BRAAE|nr:unnamed protein product [Brassicogethes aeneus]
MQRQHVEVHVATRRPRFPIAFSLSTGTCCACRYQDLATVVKTEEESDVDNEFEEEIYFGECAIKEEIEIQENDVSTEIKEENIEEQVDLWCFKCGTYENSMCRKCANLNGPGSDLPENLRLGPSGIKNDFGVFALENFERNVVFGPFTGLEKKISEKTGLETWKKKDGVLVTAENNPCYMKYIKNVENEKDQNLFIYQDGDEIFFKTVRTIFKGEELFVLYDKKIPIVVKNPEKLESYQCEFCDLSLGNRSNMRGHQRTCRWRFMKEKEECRYFQCQHCKTIIMDEAYYKTHIARCTHRTVESKIPKNPFYMKCDDCSYKTWRKPDLDRHMFRKHKKGEKMPTFKCPHCEYSSPRKNTLNRHLNTHSKTRLFKCIYCEKRISTVRNMYNHVLNNHKQENDEKQLVPIKCKVHTCEKCGYITVQLCHYKEHVKICKGAPNSYFCDRCEYRSTNKKNLNKHLKTHGNDNKGYLCNYCEYKSNQKKSLENHLLNAHPEYDHAKLITHKVHSCQMCNFTTVIQVNLSRHINSVHKK